MEAFFRDDLLFLGSVVDGWLGVSGFGSLGSRVLGLDFGEDVLGCSSGNDVLGLLFGNNGLGRGSGNDVLGLLLGNNGLGHGSGNDVLGLLFGNNGLGRSSGNDVLRLGFGYNVLGLLLGNNGLGHGSGNNVLGLNFGGSRLLFIVLFSGFLLVVLLSRLFGIFMFLVGLDFVVLVGLSIFVFLVGLGIFVFLVGFDSLVLVGLDIFVFLVGLDSVVLVGLGIVVFLGLGIFVVLRLLFDLSSGVGLFLLSNGLFDRVGLFVCLGLFSVRANEILSRVSCLPVNWDNWGSDSRSG